MFFEHLADEDDAELMRLFFDVGVFCFVPGSVPFSVWQIRRLSAQSNASSVEILFKKTISRTACTSFDQK